jgi:oligopeptide/dipeptide ABC transporter ATP-binding protein
MLEVKNLQINYDSKKVVRGISFKLAKGSTLGIIGESGSGKTTIARALTRLLPKKNIAKNSLILFENQSMTQLPAHELLKLRKHIQIVFQDPFSSFNPRMKIGKAIEEGLILHNTMNKLERKKEVYEILKKVGLSPDNYDKYPHEFSGGQRQRIALARALILKPSLIIADEPVSALDVSVQAQILNLMLDLKKEYGLTFILIAHDLGIIDYFCNEILVIYQGQMMEYGSKELLKNPAHPYTKLLLASLPEKINTIKIPELPVLKTQSDCPFFPRCPERNSLCANYTIKQIEISPGHLTSCVLYSKNQS